MVGVKIKPFNPEKIRRLKKKKQRGYGQASEGRTGRSTGGSIRARLSSGGPVAKPN